jgi:hypothetical protein
MAVKFNQTVRHGTMQFAKGSVIAFEDRDAEPYFIAAGWAEPSTAAPAITYDIGAVDIDPETVFGDGQNKGQRVLNVE